MSKSPIDIKYINLLTRFSVVLIFALVISSCNDTTFEGSTKIYDYFQSQSFQGFFLENEYGYYYTLNGYVYYSDKDDLDFIKLCNKPDCYHNDENCNAYINCSSVIHPYKDKIYFSYIERKAQADAIVLACMNADGTMHRVVRILGEYLPISYSYIMHGEYIFYVVEGYNEEKKIRVNELFYASLEDVQTKPKLIANAGSVLDKPSAIHLAAGSGNGLYYFVTEENESKLFRFDIQSANINEVRERDTIEKGRWFDKDSSYYFDLEGNYMSQNTITGESSKITEITDDNEYGPLFSNGDMWFRVNYSYGSKVIPDEYLGVFIYDMDGIKIGFVPYSMPTNNYSNIVITDKYFILFRLIPSSPGFTIDSYSYFDLEDIGTDRIKWADMEP